MMARRTAPANHRTGGGPRRQRAQVRQAIERLVDQVDPEIRSLRHYRRELFDVTELLLEHSRRLAQEIPGPVAVDRQAWGSDPLVNVLFDNPRRLREVMASPAVRRFLQDAPQGNGEGYALLMALPTLHDHLAVGLLGGTVREDAEQAAAGFSGHEVILPGADSEAVRTQVGQRMLDTLVESAALELIASEERIMDLEHRLELALLHQRMSRPPPLELDIQAENQAARRTMQATLAAQISRLKRGLTEARRGFRTLDDYLARLIALLERPEDLVATTWVRMRFLPRLPVAGSEGANRGVELDLLRARRGERLGRALLLTRYPRADLIDAGERLAKLARFVDGRRSTR